jgi:molybdate transport system substrate-binding protein
MANEPKKPFGRRVSGEKVEPKLVYGENIAQTAQYVLTGNAQVGIVALSLAVNAGLASKGGYWLVPDNLHQPLEQGFIITKRAEKNPVAKRFADYISSKPARAVMTKYGFVLPGEAASK